MERLSQHSSVVSNMIRALADEGRLHNRQQELHASRRTDVPIEIDWREMVRGYKEGAVRS